MAFTLEQLLVYQKTDAICQRTESFPRSRKRDAWDRAAFQWLGPILHRPLEGHR